MLAIAQWLSKKRGERWVKEMEYVYLLLGCVGIVGLINRLQNIDDRMLALKWLGPVVLSIAVAFRFVKTRAELDRWWEFPKDG